MISIILFLVLGVIVDLFIIKKHRKENAVPNILEWIIDEGVSSSDEVFATDLLEKYGKKEVISLSASFTVHESIRDFVEQFSTLEFDAYTMDYDRREFLFGEGKEKWSRGFYCIGSDGGEVLFYVRKSLSDARVYAFDMEESECPEPYASNVRRFVVIRYNAWCAMKQLEGKPEKEGND